MNAVIALLAILLTAAPASLKAPKDFALRLEFGCAVPDVINTAAGTYEVEGSRGGRAGLAKAS